MIENSLQYLERKKNIVIQKLQNIDKTMKELELNYSQKYAISKEKTENYFSEYYTERIGAQKEYESLEEVVKLFDKKIMLLKDNQCEDNNQLEINQQLLNDINKVIENKDKISKLGVSIEYSTKIMEGYGRNIYELKKKIYDEKGNVIQKNGIDYFKAKKLDTLDKKYLSQSALYYDALVAARKTTGGIYERERRA